VLARQVLLTLASRRGREVAVEPGRFARILGEELKQAVVDLVGVSPADVVRAALDRASGMAKRATRRGRPVDVDAGSGTETPMLPLRRGDEAWARLTF